jgi:hypothetical protein
VENDGIVVLVLLVFVVGQTPTVTAEDMAHTAVDEAYTCPAECSFDYVRPGFGY